jgi:hypothetical protein
MASPEVNLSVNDEPITIDDFVKKFINSVVTGMLSVLKGVKEIKSVNLSFDGDEVEIVVNGAIVPSNPFVSKFIENTVTGMVTSLKGVGRVDKLEISITN